MYLPDVRFNFHCLRYVGVAYSYWLHEVQKRMAIDTIYLYHMTLLNIMNTYIVITTSIIHTKSFLYQDTYFILLEIICIFQNNIPI